MRDILFFPPFPPSIFLMSLHPTILVCMKLARIVSYTLIIPSASAAPHGRDPKDPTRRKGYDTHQTPQITVCAVHDASAWRDGVTTRRDSFLLVFWVCIEPWSVELSPPRKVV